MKAIITTYEEKTFRIERIEVIDTYVSKNTQVAKEYFLETDYIEEALNYFKKTDKKKNLYKKESRYFYNPKSIKILMNLLKENKLTHLVGYRNIGTSEHPCFEVNFKEILNKTVPEEY